MTQAPQREAGGHKHLETEFLARSYREMYLTIRALHLCSENGSPENKLLADFFSKELLKENWTDEANTKRKLESGMKLIQGIVEGSKNQKPQAKEAVKTATRVTPPLTKPSETTKGPQQRKVGDKRPYQPEREPVSEES